MYGIHSYILDMYVRADYSILADLLFYIGKSEIVSAKI